MEVKEVYEIIAKEFDHSRSYRWKWIDTFIDTIIENGYIFDIGCGSGRNMLSNKHNFIGIDFCDSFINICRNKQLNVIKSNMIELPFMKKSADALIVIASFHHLKTKMERIMALKEMYRVLKPNGKILLSVWSKNQPKKTRRVFENYGDVYVSWKKRDDNRVLLRYYYIFKIEELRELFEISGFKIENHEWNCGNEIFTLIKK